MSKYKGKTARVQIRGSYHKRLKAHAKKLKMTLFEIMDEAIAEYLMEE